MKNKIKLEKTSLYNDGKTALNPDKVGVRVNSINNLKTQ